jgi:hypothetical protein
VNRSVKLAISALSGAAFLAAVSESDILLGALMGALLAATIAIAVFAFPTDLDYRERRVWPPREP